MRVWRRSAVIAPSISKKSREQIWGGRIMSAEIRAQGAERTSLALCSHQAKLPYLSSTKRKAATRTAIQIIQSTMRTVSRLIRQHRRMAAIVYWPLGRVAARRLLNEKRPQLTERQAGAAIPMRHVRGAPMTGACINALGNRPFLCGKGGALP